jgi:hypothetical protein
VWAAAVAPLAAASTLLFVFGGRNEQHTNNYLFTLDISNVSLPNILSLSDFCSPSVSFVGTYPLSMSISCTYSLSMSFLSLFTY